MIPKDPKSSWEDRDQFEDETTTESVDDLGVKPEEFERLVIAPSDWTVNTIYDLLGKQVQLDPAYQRRNVWQATAKSQFIESLFLGIPIPQILLASKAGQKNAFLVLDGKQRLNTIKEFIDGVFVDSKPFRLSGLRILKDLNGKSWSEIKQDKERADSLLNEPLRTTVLRGWESEAVLYEIFYRLNSGSVKLSPMELRMSLFPGDFLKFIISWTEQIGPLHRLLRKTQPDARMSDVELAIRHLAFKDEKSLYRGNLKVFLDEFCKAQNNKFSQEPVAVSDCDSALQEMNDAIIVGIDEFHERDFCRKFAARVYESRFNRAIFDVLVGALSYQQVREWVASNPGQMKKLYEKVCSESVDFLRSVETTTKSSEATHLRFRTWYSEIEKSTGIKVPLPKITSNSSP